MIGGGLLGYTPRFCRVSKVPRLHVLRTSQMNSLEKLQMQLALEPLLSEAVVKEVRRSADHTREVMGLRPHFPPRCAPHRGLLRH